MIEDLVDSGNICGGDSHDNEDKHRGLQELFPGRPGALSHLIHGPFDERPYLSEKTEVVVHSLQMIFTAFAPSGPCPEPVTRILCLKMKWQERRVSNSRPAVLETAALPTELHP